MKKKDLWKVLFNTSIILLSIGLLVYFCFSENGLVDLIKSAAGFDKGWLIMAILCHLLNIILDAYLIFIFTKNSTNQYTFIKSIKTCMVGQFFSAVTPGASGGQPMQMFIMSKQGISPGAATSALMQKFLVYQTTITIYSLLAILICFNIFSGTVNSVMLGLAIFGFITQSIVIIFLLMLSFNRKLTYAIINFAFSLLAKIHLIKNADQKIKSWEQQLENFYRSNQELYKNRTLVLKTYIICAVQITAIFIVPYCIYRCFNLSGARIIDMICCQAFVAMISSFIPLPGASGASEGSFYVFFNLYFTESTIMSAILLWRIITYYFTILISMPFSRISSKSGN